MPATFAASVVVVEQVALGALARRIADHAGGAADDDDRPVAGALQPRLHDHRHEVADVQARRRRVVAGVERHGLRRSSSFFRASRSVTSATRPRAASSSRMCMARRLPDRAGNGGAASATSVRSIIDFSGSAIASSRAARRSRLGSTSAKSTSSNQASDPLITSADRRRSRLTRFRARCPASRGASAMTAANTMPDDERPIVAAAAARRKYVRAAAQRHGACRRARRAAAAAAPHRQRHARLHAHVASPCRSRRRTRRRGNIDADSRYATAIETFEMRDVELALVAAARAPGSS